MYDVEDLILAQNMLELARESRDEDEIEAAREYLKEVRSRLDRSPQYDHNEVSAYDLILQGT